MTLAPIVISVYTRINHFKECIEALVANPLSTDSELYIYSDAAFHDKDKGLVERVREYSYNITGFKNVHIVEREKNYGGMNNSKSAHIEITEKYGKSIFMEDDIVVAPGFLEFMNQALEFYNDDKHILNITGYCPPIAIPDDYDCDVFILPRYNGWGCGSYKRTIDAAIKLIDKNEFDSIPDKAVLEVGGTDVLRMIKMEVEGRIDAGDVRCMYYQALNDKYTIYPRHSLVHNIGHDGTGIHCRDNTKFDVVLWDKVSGFSFDNNIQVDTRILLANRKFRRLSNRARLVDLSKRIGLFPSLKRLKEFIS